MRYGIITDIHNNVTALRAVLDRLQQKHCDRIICCGDIIGIGPCPEETVQEMMRIPGLISVRGNHENYLLEGMPAEYPNEENMSYGEMEHHKWEHGLLSAESVAFLRSMPYRIDFESEGMTVSVMHSCMDREGHFSGSKRNPDSNDLAAMFAGVNSDRNIARAGILTIENGNAGLGTFDVTYQVDEVIHQIDMIHYPEADIIKKIFYGV